MLTLTHLKMRMTSKVMKGHIANFFLAHASINKVLIKVSSNSNIDNAKVTKDHFYAMERFCGFLIVRDFLI